MWIAAFLVSFSLLDLEKTEGFKNDEKRLKETGESDPFAFGFHCAMRVESDGFSACFYSGCLRMRKRSPMVSFGLLCSLASREP